MRVVAIGSPALMDGFSLLGVETLVDPDRTEFERLLQDLLRRRERALIYLQQSPQWSESPLLQQIRREGGELLVSELPPLHQVERPEPLVEALIARVMGRSVLENRS